MCRLYRARVYIALRRALSDLINAAIKLPPREARIVRFDLAEACLIFVSVKPVITYADGRMYICVFGELFVCLTGEY